MFLLYLYFMGKIFELNWAEWIEGAAIGKTIFVQEYNVQNRKLPFKQKPKAKCVFFQTSAHK